MNGEKIKILLVEDDALSFLDAKKFLEDEGYEVLSLPGKVMIDNYEDAIDLCQKEIPHIAIVDIKIKGPKDGLDVAGYIRENFYSPVIILSAHESQAYLQRARILGVDGYIAKLDKPYGLKQLGISLSMILPFAETAAKRRKESIFLDVKEYSEKSHEDQYYIKRRIAWSSLKLITTVNAPKNALVLHLTDGRIYVHRSSLTDFQTHLPVYFIRINQYEMVNSLLFDGKGKSQWVYYIGGKRYEIAAPYRTAITEAHLRNALL